MNPKTNRAESLGYEGIWTTNSGAIPCKLRVMSTSSSHSDQALDLLRSATECAKAQDFEQARLHLTELLDIEPQHEVAMGMLAAVYAELKTLDRASDYFRRVLEINPDNVLARFQLGIVQLEIGHAEDALATWQLGNYGPNDYLVKYHSGLALLQLDRPSEALAAFQSAQQFMPVDHVLYPKLLEFLIKLSN